MSPVTSMYRLFLARKDRRIMDIFLKELEGQGHLGDLKKKSTPELQELLCRQHQILDNRQVIRRLPDKGSKIRSLCACLESVLESREQVDKTADLLHQMALSAETARTARGHTDMEVVEASNPLDVIRNQPIGEKQIIDEREDDQGVFSDGFIASYNRVIKPAEERCMEEPPKEKFMLNRTLKNKDLLSSSTLKSELLHASSYQPAKVDSEKKEQDNSDPDRRPQPNASCQNLSPGGSSRRLKHTYDESLEESMIHVSKNESTKILSVEESIRVLRSQMEKQELLAAQQAAQKLGESLKIRTKPFNPEGSSFVNYRDTVLDDLDNEDKLDSDDEQELDYPD